MRKLGCFAALLVLLLMGIFLWPESEPPLRTDVEPLQRRLVLDGGISRAQWRARPKFDDRWTVPTPDNYLVLTGLIEVPAVEDWFAATADARPVQVSAEGDSLEALESAALLAQLNARMQERRDETLKPCCLKRFAWCRQRNLVYIELECY